MLLLYCHNPTPRFQYVIDWIFNYWGIKYTLTGNVDDFVRFPGPKMGYGDQCPDSGKAVWVRPSGLLEDDSLRVWDLKVEGRDAVAYFFCNNGFMGFDIFSAVFYMISRYEEYLPFEADDHRRFPAAASLAYRNNFLTMPVVDIWLREMKEKLRAIFPGLSFHDQRFAARFTYDIDIAFKYAGRSVIKNILSLSRDVITGRFTNVVTRIQTIAGGKCDPWNPYDHIQRVIQESGIPATFFIPSVTRSSAYDRNLPPGSRPMKDLLKHLDSFAEIGLHPSYFTSENGRLIEKEKRSLEAATGRHISSSRQHFLKFKLPDTFLSLLDASMKHDYSMAFADAPGFRAGTSRPFYFYDLQNERSTSLTLHPVCWMDATFIHYLDQDSAAAAEVAIGLIEKIKDVEGVFIPIFHNNYLESDAQRAAHDLILRVTKRQLTA